MSRPAALVLVATPIGNLGDLAPRAVAELRDADVIAAEDTRRTRKLLSATGVPGGDRLVAVHEHNEAEMARRLAGDVTKGRRVVYVTDAGMPGISDPGARLVRTCLDAGLPVEVVPGPSAAVAALVVSGLPTDRFVFEGFLPRKGKERTERLAALAGEERTAVLFEAANRLAATVADLAAALGPDRALVLARELTKVHEEVWRGTLGSATANATTTATAATAAALPVEPRGEVVIVLGPAPPPAPVDDAALTDALAAELGSGASARDAAASVAETFAVSKRRVYDLAVRMRGRASR